MNSARPALGGTPVAAKHRVWPRAARIHLDKAGLSILHGLLLTLCLFRTFMVAVGWLAFLAPYTVLCISIALTHTSKSASAQQTSWLSEHESTALNHLTAAL